MSNSTVFRVSARVIWFSALFMGVLASIPKILQLHITLIELAVDASVAFLFSLFVWYFNIYSLPKFSNRQFTSRFFNLRLLYSLLLGIGLMFLLVSAHQLLFPHYKFESMIMMYEFRGILINLTIYMFLYLLYQSYHTQLIGIELERVKADHIGAQYELLKQQVNPHFLFNSLNTLKSMIEIGDAHSVEFVLKLSDFYRFTLNNRQQDIIPLSEELNILQAYMFLLEARFEEGINLNINIETSAAFTFIPPFTLQLLVENCVKHNVISLEHPLNIKLYTADDTLIVENQLQLKKNPEASTGMGLENINQRYQHLTQKEIRIEQNTISFKVILPLIYENPVDRRRD
ncbi:sensor histidine kinase [Dyadobacter sediminis]|uniref:sensor histidine kinase n=1 Tax=Dyadobacter sediminis TaxID=1493691 RepID=UPI001E4FF778|nr:histidine kinase [Dyadobacter sediminis]